MTPPTTLSRQAFANARRFIETSARPLEVARFHHQFDGAPGTGVLDVLRTYQNADGGFGQALEPDLRAPESSALATTVAFQVIRETKAPAYDDMIQPALGYLLDTLDKSNAHWRIIPAAAENSPHAPWWTQTGRETGFDRFSLNPTAEILGYLYDYQEQVREDVRELVANRVVQHLGDRDEIEMHDLLCVLRLLNTKRLPAEVRAPVQQKAAALVDNTISKDPAAWKGYGLRPVQVMDRPDSPFIKGNEELVAANLDFEIESQNKDGAWSPPWTWGDMYPEFWPQAEREWKGVLTLDKLLLLKRFGRIEGLS